MSDELIDDLADEVVDDDIVIYEDEPDFDRSQRDDEGSQDDGEVFQGMGLMARATNAIRNFKEALGWYRANRTTAQIGFNPDGMCLKVCRTARNIPAKYLTAKQAQDATPAKYRVKKIANLRKGMVLYFDDPKDSNTSGHIVTQIGRVKGFDPNSLDDILVDTNSVVSGQIVTVRASYFQKHWGDKFQFGAKILNGVELDLPGAKKSKVERFNNGGPIYNLNLLNDAAKNGRAGAGEILRRIEDAIRRLPDNKSINHVREFKDEWRETRKIDMRHLNKAVESGRVGLVKTVRDEIIRLIAALPEE